MRRGGSGSLRLAGNTNHGLTLAQIDNHSLDLHHLRTVFFERTIRLRPKQFVTTRQQSLNAFQRFFFSPFWLFSHNTTQDVETGMLKIWQRPSYYIKSFLEIKKKMKKTNHTV